MIISFFVLIFSILEHFLVGYFKEVNFSEVYNELLSSGIYADLAKLLVVFLLFLLFFAFLEIARILGVGKVLNLFFSQNAKDSEN